MKTVRCSSWQIAAKMHFSTCGLFFCGSHVIKKKKISCEIVVITLDPFDAKISYNAKPTH